MTHYTVTDIADAAWRVSIMAEIETDGGTLNERQVKAYTDALAIVAAGPVNGTPVDGGDTGAPREHKAGGNTNGYAVQPPVTEKQLTNLRREIPRRVTDSPTVRMIAAKLAAGDDTAITCKAARTALGILFAAPFIPRPSTQPVGEMAAILPARSDLAPEPVRNGRDGHDNSPAVTEEGSYRKDGVVYRVRASKSSGRLYAEELSDVTGKFSYARGMIYRLSAADRMTVDEAAAYGTAHGWCAICGRHLTNGTSVAKGIGPICATKV